MAANRRRRLCVCGSRATVVIRSQDSGQGHPFILTLLDGDVEVDSLKSGWEEADYDTGPPYPWNEDLQTLYRVARRNARNIGALIESLTRTPRKAASRSSLARRELPEFGWHARWPAQPATHASATRRHRRAAAPSATACPCSCGYLRTALTLWSRWTQQRQAYQGVLGPCHYRAIHSGGS